MSSKKKAKSLALALGESTHTHMLTSARNITFEELVLENIDFSLQSTGVLRHEEHDRIVLPKGRYLKVNQVEYDPFSNSVRAVFD
jgi:hypothetical protein